MIYKKIYSWTQSFFLVAFHSPAQCNTMLAAEIWTLSTSWWFVRGSEQCNMTQATKNNIVWAAMRLHCTAVWYWNKTFCLDIYCTVEICDAHSSTFPNSLLVCECLSPPAWNTIVQPRSFLGDLMIEGLITYFSGCCPYDGSSATACGVTSWKLGGQNTLGKMAPGCVRLRPCFIVSGVWGWVNTVWRGFVHFLLYA